MTDHDVVALKQRVESFSTEVANWSDRADEEADRLFQTAVERYGEICIAQSSQQPTSAADLLDVVPIPAEIRQLYERWSKECQPLFARLSAFPTTSASKAFAASVGEVCDLLAQEH